MVNRPDLEILKNLKRELVESFGEEIVNVILFGSHAKNFAHENSDVDIIVIIKNKDADWKFKDSIRNIFYDYSIDYGILFDILIISEHELQHTLRGSQPVFKKALNQGIYL